jgi:hypothetical protein
MYMSKRRSGLAYQRRAYHICCAPKTCSPGTITGLISYNFSPVDISWNVLPGATSYTVTTTNSVGAAAPVVTYTSPATTATIEYSTSDTQTVTVTAFTRCGTTSSNVEVQPCFLAGSLVHMADGTTKPIEEVQVNDLVIGAFGEINRVLALHHPILGKSEMCKINDEHSTTNHHPHISIDKKFYCGDTDLGSTYGHKHNVIDEDGNIVERMLDGLNKERIQTLHTGVELKTIEGSRITKSIEIYSMPEDTQLYNLVIDGSHTYHVDGYAVTGWPSENDFDYDNWSRK